MERGRGERPGPRPAPSRARRGAAGAACGASSGASGSTCSTRTTTRPPSRRWWSGGSRGRPVVYHGHSAHADELPLYVRPAGACAAGSGGSAVCSIGRSRAAPTSASPSATSWGTACGAAGARRRRSGRARAGQSAGRARPRLGWTGSERTRLLRGQPGCVSGRRPPFACVRGASARTSRDARLRLVSHPDARRHAARLASRRPRAPGWRSCWPRSYASGPRRAAAGRRGGVPPDREVRLSDEAADLHGHGKGHRGVGRLRQGPRGRRHRACGTRWRSWRIRGCATEPAVGPGRPRAPGPGRPRRGAGRRGLGRRGWRVSNRSIGES